MSLTHKLYVLALVLFAHNAFAADVLTQRGSNARQGTNLNETVLNPSTVNPNTFGLLYALAVDGNVAAQPLYVNALGFPDGSTHNTLVAVTSHNNVYAYDADSATLLWSANLGPYVPSSVF